MLGIVININGVRCRIRVESVNSLDAGNLIFKRRCATETFYRSEICLFENFNFILRIILLKIPPTFGKRRQLKITGKRQTQCNENHGCNRHQIFCGRFPVNIQSVFNRASVNAIRTQMAIYVVNSFVLRYRNSLRTFIIAKSAHRTRGRRSFNLCKINAETSHKSDFRKRSNDYQCAEQPNPT